MHYATTIYPSRNCSLIFDLFPTQLSLPFCSNFQFSAHQFGDPWWFWFWTILAGRVCISFHINNWIKLIVPRQLVARTYQSDPLDCLHWAKNNLSCHTVRGGFKNWVKFWLLAELPLTPPPPPNLGPVIRLIFFIGLFKSTPFKTWNSFMEYF